MKSTQNKGNSFSAKASVMEEEKYMRRAIDLALRAEAQAISPNPRVGAVLVHEGRVIGEGCHSRVGCGHAEVNCLASVRTSDRPLIAESTMYVTLEPCAHEGRTPSCARRLVSERIRRVVVGTMDPFPLVTGRGIQILRDGGVEVVAPFMERECRDLTRVFLTNQTLHRPYITLKWAESADGFLDSVRTTDEVPPIRLSSPFSRMLVHQQRSMHSAILVGRHTYELDHPSLTNRDWLLSPYSPRRILLSAEHPADLQEGWMHISGVSESILRRLLDDDGVTSLLVEGGAATHRAFVEQGLWDEVRREVCPIQLKSGVPAPGIPHGAELSEARSLDGRSLECWTRVV